MPDGGLEDHGRGKLDGAGEIHQKCRGHAGGIAGDEKHQRTQTEGNGNALIGHLHGQFLSG